MHVCIYVATTAASVAVQRVTRIPILICISLPPSVTCRTYIHSSLQPLDQTFVTNTANPRAALEATLSGVYSTLQLGGTIMARVGDERYELFVTEYVSLSLSPFYWYHFIGTILLKIAHSWYSHSHLSLLFRCVRVF